MTLVNSRCDDGLLRLELNRPDRLNALNTPLLTELKTLLAEAESDDVRAVVLAGAGRAFSSGGDLRGEDTKGVVDVAAEVITAITELPKPVVAAVQGPAVGLGCSLALACDLAVVARSAFFQLAFVRVGLMPDGAASLLVPASLGRARAARLAMTGERLSAEDAFAWGLVSHVVDDETFADELSALVSSLADGPTRSYGWIKRALATSTLAALPSVHEIEARGQRELVRTDDYRVAREAFAARSEPRFTGH